MAFMSMNRYQSRAYATAAFGEQSIYPFYALAEEAGEVSGKLAKWMRKNNAQPDFKNLDPKLKEDLIKELGDVLWNVAVAAIEVGIDLETLAYLNLEKLQGRVQNNTIIGEGDDR